MKIKVLRVALGQPVEAPKEVEVADGATYADVLVAAGVPFNNESMTLSYACAGDLYFFNCADLDGKPDEDETVGVFDNMLFKSASEVAIDKAAAGADHLKI